jgi:hypothetical protein
LINENINEFEFNKICKIANFYKKNNLTIPDDLFENERILNNSFPSSYAIENIRIGSNEQMILSKYFY